MKRLLSFYLLVSVIVLYPLSIPAAETTPHTIPWIKHKATINPEGNVHSLEFGPEGKYLGVELNGEFLIYDLSTYEKITHIEPTDQRSWQETTFDDLVIGPNAEKFYIAAGYYVKEIWGSSSEGWIQVHDLQTGKKLKEIAHHDWDLNNLEAGPNRRFLVSTDFVDQALIYDTKKNHYLPIFDPGIGNLSGGGDIIKATDYHLLLASNKVKIYKTTLENISFIDRTLNSFTFGLYPNLYSQHLSFATYISSSPNGKFLMRPSSQDVFTQWVIYSGVKIFHLKDGSVFDTYSSPQQNSFEALKKRRDKLSPAMAWGADSQWFLKADQGGRINLRHLKGGHKLLRFKPYPTQKSVQGIWISPTNEALITRNHQSGLTAWSWNPPDTNPLEKTLKMQDELKE